NCHAMIDPALPFGGYKESGIGHEQGRLGLEAYLETKSVLMKLYGRGGGMAAPLFRLADLAALKESATPITTELSGLIGVESVHHAELVKTLQAAILSGDAANVARQYCSPDMWGGSGSVADLILDRPGAQKRCLVLLSKLNSKVRDAGIGCPRATQWTGVFDQWLEQGVFDSSE